MATIFSHSFVGWSLTRALIGPDAGRKLFYASALSTIVADADVLSFRFGIPYAADFGHRGITHSIFFAVLWTAFLAILAKKICPQISRSRFIIVIFISTLSHPIFDALTNGGLGVGFFLPFDSTRYFFPLTPIEVSPIGFRFFSQAGWEVLQSELVTIILPFACLVILRRIFEGLKARKRST